MQEKNTTPRKFRIFRFKFFFQIFKFSKIETFPGLKRFPKPSGQTRPKPFVKPVQNNDEAHLPQGCKLVTRRLRKAHGGRRSDATAAKAGVREISR